MKVVINSEFGGFGLSPAALLWLHEHKSPLVEVIQRDSADSTRAESLVDMGVYAKLPDGSYLRDCMEESNQRAHPDLIAVVVALGPKANGHCASLKIVEIPDGIEWEISEYDGAESIEEKHRSWN